MSDVTDLDRVTELPDGALVSVRATLRHVQMKRNAMGNLWAALEIEQVDTSLTVLVFPRMFTTIASDTLKPDALLEFTGRVFCGTDDSVRLVPITTPVAVT